MRTKPSTINKNGVKKEKESCKIKTKKEVHADMLFTSGSELYNWYPLCKGKQNITVTKKALDQYIALLGVNEKDQLNAYCDIRDHVQVINDDDLPNSF